MINLVLIVVSFLVVVEELSIILLRLVVEIVHVLSRLELDLRAGVFGIVYNPLLLIVGLLLLLILLAGLHPLEIVLHLHVLVVEEERIDSLLLLSRVRSWS